ncbi:AI-2E family transporter [Croceicoccus sp. BE223]|uniref:AI-2E family transporter n=1 Tax=Croceicoccus sp. BE223 TaxID=2817716 RepID=UPI00285BC695|nr:AI-2E family transporter [Croceicoccus sp. BE223]MDR7103598.1 putative PurR-regulated permease PerM [Croceicoccus sp. BE223]
MEQDADPAGRVVGSTIGGTPLESGLGSRKLERLAGDAVPPGQESATVPDLDMGRLFSALVLMIGIGLFLALPFVLSVGSIVFLPLVTAMVLTIILSPLADRLGGIGIPNVLSSLLAVVIFVAVLVLAAAAIMQPAIDMFDRVPEMVGSIQATFGELRGQFDWINDINRQIGQIAGAKEGREVIVATPSMVERVALATPTFVIETLLTLLMTFFMIEARVRMRRRLLLERAEFGASLRAARAIREVQDRVASYILTVGVINLGVGVIAALGAWALGMDAPVMWGGLAALMNFLPYLGPLAMTGILTLVGLGTADTIVAGLIPAACYLALHAVEANAVTPAILGKRFTVNPVLILLAISYFTWIWGVMGAILSMPILITLLALFEHLGHPNIIGFLFGEPLFQHRETGEEARDSAVAGT